MNGGMLRRRDEQPVDDPGHGGGSQRRDKAKGCRDRGIDRVARRVDDLGGRDRGQAHRKADREVDAAPI